MGAEPRDRVAATISAAGINPYAAPAADLEDHEHQAAIGNDHGEFYVVAPTKFYVLSVFTFGIYTLYWFYAHFKGQKRAGMKTKPALAALFSIFTAHRLFKRLDRAADRAGLPKSPRATNQAAPYIVLALLGQALQVVSQSNQVLMVIMLLLFNLTVLPLARVQLVVNRLAGDPEGNGNRKFGPLNLGSVAIGALTWLLILFGLVLAPHT